MWGGNYYNLPPSSCWLVWDKENTGDFADCELAWTNLPKAVRIFRHMWNGFLRASERDTRRVHPAQKPVVLMKWCIEQAGSVRSIIDPFMGSSPVGVAAVQAGIEYVGIEIDPYMFEIAHRRIEDAARAARGLPKQLKDTADHTDLPLFAEVNA
jgi:DNA modification methylase